MAGSYRDIFERLAQKTITIGLFFGVGGGLVYDGGGTGEKHGETKGGEGGGAGAR